MLAWPDLYNMCQQDISKEIMVLKFSHTFPFENPISLKKIQSIYKQNNKGLSVRSISPIPAEIFQSLFKEGYS